MVLLSRGYLHLWPSRRQQTRAWPAARAIPLPMGGGGRLTLASGPLGSPAMSVFMNFLGACEHNVFEGGLNPG